MRIISQSPAKLILTGEHAILNNIPALSIAIDLPTICEINFTNQTNNIYFDIELANYQQKVSESFAILNNLAIAIENRFYKYSNNSLPIQSVLKQPIDLIIICIYHFQQKHTLKKGNWQIKIMGHNFPARGLGSSAAVIVTVLYSLYKQNNINIDKEEVLKLATTIENRQHGNSSGLDLATILFGGLIKYQPQQPIKFLPAKTFSAWFIDTGIGEDSTGQAVNFVQQHFNRSHNIWQEFKQVSQQIERAWLEQDTIKMQTAIRYNQQLLEEIGVVPNRVKHFLNKLNTTSTTAGKICGSGAISGKAAGVILSIGKPPFSLCQEYDYNIYPININNQGVYCEVVN
jgi:mevalonate kinase